MPLGDRKAAVSARFDRLVDSLQEYGVEVGPHPRILIPKKLLREDDLRVLGFQPSKTGVPEIGQSKFTSYRQSDGKFHIHDHGDMWSMHEDRRPMGVLHTLTEGVPAAYQLLKDKIKGTPGLREIISGQLPKAYIQRIRRWLPSKESVKQGALKTAPGEFAPGIPSSRTIRPLPPVPRGQPQQWHLAEQAHHADKAGKHVDLRLVDPEGHAHSWVLPETGLPKPGEKFYLPQTFTHTRDYAARKGEFDIPEGYGKGKVVGSGLRPADVHYSEPGKLRFSLLEGRNPQDYILVKSPKGWVVHNFSPTAEAGVRGSRGYAIPQAKPNYKEKKTDSIDFDDPKVIHQAKIDGAHCFVWNTPINTLEYGVLPLSVIVHQQLRVMVESGQGTEGETLWEPVTNWFQRLAEEPMRHIKVAACPTRRLRVTESHAFKTPEGDRKAVELVEGGKVITSQEALSPSLLQAVRGMMMGDASMSFGTNYFRLSITHGIPQREYCWAKFQLLEEFCRSEPREYVVDGYVEGGKRVHFSTCCNPTFYPIWSQYYSDRKGVTQELLDSLDNVSLAFWFMDDGHTSVADNSYGDNRQFFLSFHTEGYTEAENELIVAWFGRQGIHARVCKDGHGHRFVGMGANSALELLRRISPWIHPCMRYKLGESYYKFDHTIVGQLGSRWCEIDTKPKRVLWPCPVIYNEAYNPPDDPHYKYVYNLEVGKTHTYMAAGILVGNCTIHIPNKDRQVRVFSYRPTAAGTGVIEHTHKLPEYHTLRAPGALAGTVLRGEAWAAGPDGKALPAERIGGLLNAGVARSRELQGEHGPLRLSVFDVVRHKGKLMENAPYAEKLEVLRQVAKEMPQLQLPPMAETPKEKLELFTRIQEGKEPATREGIVAWHLDKPQPTKIKFRPDVDAEVVDVFPGKGKHEGRAGGVLVKVPGSETTTRVGTGFSDQMRKELWERPQEFVGRVARVATQQVFASGKLRAPAFKDFHLDKNAAQTFTADGKDYDVSKLWELAKHLPVEELRVSSREFKKNLQGGWGDKVNPLEVLKDPSIDPDHARRIQEADLSHPVTMSIGSWVADGLHRMAKAKQMGLKSVPMQRFRDWRQMEPALKTKQASVMMSALRRELNRIGHG